MRVLLAALAALTLNGCVTVVTQALFADARGVDVYGPPLRGWRLGDGRVLVETGPPPPQPMYGCVLPAAGPMDRFVTCHEPAILEFRADDDVPTPTPAAGELWPPPDATPLPLEALPVPPQGAIEVEGSHPVAFTLQALSIPVTLALDVAVTPLLFIALLVVDAVD